MIKTKDLWNKELKLEEIIEYCFVFQIDSWNVCLCSQVVPQTELLWLNTISY